MDPGPSRRRRYSSSMGKPRESPGSPKKKGPKKERWLLTRKTWRYMADAGRKLIPDGHNKPEDIPKIEAYFQEVCNKEPKFLLWRKQSYPGAVGFRRGRSRGGRKKGGSVRDRTSSADEAEDLKSPQSSGSPQPSTSRSDLQRMKEEFFFGRQHHQQQLYEQEEEMLGTLERYLSQPRPGTLDTDKLIEKLKEHLASIEREGRERNVRHVEFEGDREETGLLDTLRRYYSKSTSRDKVISDLLTDRKKLENLYFDLRKARNFNSRRGGGGRIGGTGLGGGSYGLGPLSMHPSRWHRRDWPKEYDQFEEDETTEDTGSTNPGSPTFVIEADEPGNTKGTQTRRIAPHSWTMISEEVKKLRAAKEAEQEKEEKKLSGPGGPRRSSVDNDDVSPSVSDTIKRYLRMARKKSVDSDKVDRFKRVNYDRNLRNIKGKGEPSISEDDGSDKGAQTDEVWIEALRDLKIDTVEAESAPSSRSSLNEEPVSPTARSFLSSGQTFLSNLLHGLQDKSVSAGGMQKSKSSTSVVQQGSRLVSKKIWKTARSKSQSRATPSSTSVWTPQGRCVWSNVAGRTVTLTDTTLQQLTEIERKILQKVALAKLQALNLGVNIRIPSESSAPAAVQKPKRKPYLLKRKAITTGFFDTSRKEEKDKGGGESSGGGLVFGIPLSQCVESERLRQSARQEPEEAELRRKSRGSFSSLVETTQRAAEEKGSCESLIGGTLSMPGLDMISCGSTANLAAPEAGVPTIVTACLRHLENHGLHTLGIFRVSSSKKRVRQLREDFDCGKEINLDEDPCPHDVATLLKEYFRDLPDSLLCKDLYQAFIQTQKIRNRRLQHEAIQHLVQLLPIANRDTLLVLLTFLALVAYHSDDQKDSSGQWVEGNKMDSSNLATLFAPNILHNCSKGAANKSELSAERVEERSDAINVIRSLIDNYKTLFQVSAELLDEVYVHMMDSNPEALDQLLKRRDIASDDFDDSTSATLDDADKKYWSREACTHEGAATGGPDVSMRPRRVERGRERISKKRRDESRRRGDSSEGSSRRASDDKARMSSSDSGHHTPDESNTSDGIITASLKIPVPSVTSFSLNLDDIPFIEDSDRHQLSLGLMKSGGGGSQPESGVGSFSPPTRPPSVTSWGSTPTSPECEPTTATITFPSRPQPPQLQRVIITNTSQLQQVQPTSLRGESHVDHRHFSSTSYSRHLSSESKVTKSASSGVVAERQERSTFTPSISSIGGAVLRSKTADIERMLRINTSSLGTKKVNTVSDKDFKRKYTDSRHLTRNLVEERGESNSSRSESRGVWKRKEIISSEPKERRNLV